MTIAELMKILETLPPDREAFIQSAGYVTRLDAVENLSIRGTQVAMLTSLQSSHRIEVRYPGLTQEMIDSYDRMEKDNG